MADPNPVFGRFDVRDFHVQYGVTWFQYASRSISFAMRHSRLGSPPNYTDPALLDVAGAVNALPAFNGLIGS
jgi:hypothetical protein